MFTDDAYIDYSSAGAAAGSRDGVADWYARPTGGEAVISVSLYGPGYVPRATEYRIHQRVLALRVAAKPLRLGGTLL